MDENYLSFGVPTPCLPNRCVFKCFFITKATLKKKRQKVMIELKHKSQREIYAKF